MKPRAGDFVFIAMICTVVLGALGLFAVVVSEEQSAAIAQEETRGIYRCATLGGVIRGEATKRKNVYNFDNIGVVVRSGICEKTSKGQ